MALLQDRILDGPVYVVKRRYIGMICLWTCLAVDVMVMVILGS